MREYNGSGGKCHLCDGRADATWRGGTGATIAICSECAINVLPALIADAVFLPGGATGQNAAKHAVREVETIYWRALALRLLREAR
jgi:hypothetical protein